MRCYQLKPGRDAINPDSSVMLVNRFLYCDTCQDDKCASRFLHRQLPSILSIICLNVNTDFFLIYM